MSSQVFRVRSIPPDADISEVLSILREKFLNNHIDPDESSIAPSPYDNTQTAFIQFFNFPPETLANLGHNGSIVLTYRFRPKKVNIIIDKDFYELTQLYKPEELPITADIVAVSGLNGHAYGSWRRKRGSGSVQSMWLRDFLCDDLPSCRTMIFGCNTNLTDSGTHTISDYALTLLDELRKARRTQEEKARPIVFIGHSFGGVIIAQAIVKAKENDRIHGTIFKNTHAIAFFGTPHQGLSVDDLLGMLKEGSPRTQLVQSLRSGNSQLEAELDRFVNCCDDIKIITFYEAIQTRRVVTTPKGVSTATGDRFLRVDRRSAILRLPSRTEQVHVADGDHSDMVKFKHNKERSYQSFLDHFRNFSFSQNVESQAPTPLASTPLLTPRLTPHLTPLPTRDLRQGRGIPVPESSQVTALGALLSKDVPALRRILKKTPGAVNERQWDNETTLLHIAIGQRDESMVLVLLDYPVNLAVEDKDNLTALNVAAIEGLSGIVKILLARLGTANTQEKASSLIGASSAGHLGTVEVLLGSGIGLEGTSLKLLLQYGANLQARAHNGMSALHRAVIGGKQDVVAVLVQEHTRMRIPVDIKENAGQSPLHVAARKGYKAIAETLIQNGAGIEERCQGGNTPLITASGHGQKGVVLVLLARGADVAAVDRQGMAPLAWAAKGGFFEVVEALLAKGAYIDRVDIYNQSALFYATTGGHGRVVELLLRVRAQRVQASIQQAQMMRAQAVSMAQAQRYGYGHPYGPQPSPHWPYR
ncbi:uncharacterized protein H6S33_008223 [Morchella sextelata]|uniref:uncharacterized protein n=1 Tax=Morchella sextelata TaxID=1174677 RepID=UPI001D04497B|nr:uncharacterized protein H6S33_008223 [Morchella sextelata]KAH0603219.1 hypothetical protein H6S33_008223 [Morchella sextelata]